MKEFIRIGVDLANNDFQIHALESEDGRATTRKLGRQAMRKFFLETKPSGNKTFWKQNLLETKPCLVGMEACGSAHYGARELIAMGHEVRPIPPIYTKPYVKRGKNEAADAAAIEPRPCHGQAMRFVPVKNVEQQATLMLHKTRELLIKQQTMGVNALRSHLSEFGIVVAKGTGRIDALIEKAKDDATLPGSEGGFAGSRPAVGGDRCFHRRSRPRDRARRCAKPGQPIAGGHSGDRQDNSAIVASAPDPKVFKLGRATFPLGSERRRAKIPAVAKGSSAPSPNRATVTSGGCSCWAEQSRQAIAEGRPRWLARGGQVERGLARLAGRASRAQTREMGHGGANKLAPIVWAVLTAGEAFREETFARA